MEDGPLALPDPAIYAAFEGPRVRDRLVAALRFDLLGPESPEEALPQSPATRYLVGMLAPPGTPLDTAEDESIDTAQESGGPEAGPVTTFSLTPSSIGLSFVVDPSARDLVVTASWGEYEKRERVEEEAPEEVEPEEASDIDREEDADETAKMPRKKHEWVRTPHEVALTLGVLEMGKPHYEKVGEQVQAGWSVRQLGKHLVVSVFLVNRRHVPPGQRPPDEMWLYQPQLRVSGEGAPFLARKLDRGEINLAPDPDPDIASANVLYRNRFEFATGHGVAAAWTVAEEGNRATELWTEVIPGHRVPIVRARESEAPLDMDLLAAAGTGEEAEQLLRPLMDAYEQWIEERAGELAGIEAPDDAVAAEHVKLARKSLTRMREGAVLLGADPNALMAFRFANRAMAMQRRHTVAVLLKRRGQPAMEHIDAAWRPFQIGFILQCLPGIVDPSSPDRAIADLLWFPTGGGKTEAYLGLTAFTLAYRRLVADPGGLDRTSGTSVLMRYTLRLLTIQQFQRATALMCACEVIRVEEPGRWGEAPFSIGLWVGESVTPNNYADGKQNLAKLKSGQAVYEANPCQILYCPWCGDDITPEHYVALDDEERIRVKCWNEACDFFSARAGDGLPVVLVDQEIYRNPPSLLLATVDKFAQMAWNGRIQSLFGRVEKWCPRHGFISTGEGHPASHPQTTASPKTVVEDCASWLAPPDLIIQDELHLISGPLGTMTGIYETAVDGLCSRVVEGIRVSPKVIASTATVRGAHDQIEALFLRKTTVFPPLGLDAADSFFAHEDDDLPGRLYLGIYAPGKSIKTALVRVYAALLSRAEYEFDDLRDADEAARAEADSYMTLVGYFNSLRELGGAVRLVDDDVPARLRVLRKRGFGPSRLLYEKKELTSRKSSTDIAARLKELDRTFLKREKGSYPIDVLLASNMISVGVDIDRLGLMVVSAQPKTSAEYIQASSRIGRVHPGLVVEVYNWVRPRDTSHYERFIHYHDTFYRHVEATSVTPFSARARDRALPAVMVSYVRQANPQLAHELDANDFDPQHPGVQGIINELAARAEEITGRADVGEETRQMLMNLVEEWQSFESETHPLRYSSRGIKAADRANWTILLRQMELGGTTDPSDDRGRWRAAGSLREVEAEVDVVLLDQRGTD